MTTQIWICIAIITLAAAVGVSHRVRIIVNPVNVQEVVR